MTLGPVMLNIEGCELTDEDRRRLTHPQTGGIVLFSRNYRNPDQLAELCREIHALRDPPLVISVDHEGGRVQRFRDGFQALPAMGRLGDLYDQEPEEAIRLAELFAWIMAAELRHYGVDLSFAPVLDVGGPHSSVIGDRAFHRDPEAICRLANAWIRGMRAAGMEAVGKHFPGHGTVAGDSHHVMPFDNREFSEIENLDLVPFRRVIDTHLAGIMMAHVIYDRVDAQPAGYSRYWIETVLRGQLEFDGIVFSDDLNMAGAESVGGFAARGQRALAAGCDILLVCNNAKGADDVLESLGDYSNPTTQLRMVRLHGEKREDDLLSGPRWQAACDELERFHQRRGLSDGEDLFE
jgi:beta-N-acetylhexosaminidase